jgi:hypothetical protein
MILRSILPISSKRIRIGNVTGKIKNTLQIPGFETFVHGTSMTRNGRISYRANFLLRTEIAPTQPEFMTSKIRFLMTLTESRLAQGKTQSHSLSIQSPTVLYKHWNIPVISIHKSKFILIAQPGTVKRNIFSKYISYWAGWSKMRLLFTGLWHHIQWLLWSYDNKSSTFECHS